MLQALILASGMGKRLKLPHPKALLSFNGETLLARHLRLLSELGAENTVVTTGHQGDQIEAALRLIPAPTTTIFNPRHELGSVLSLQMGMAAVDPGADLLVMDADVLYDPGILRALAGGQHPNAMALDREFAAGDEPVKICLKDGRIVEFRKQLPADLTYDVVGESVGFFRFSPEGQERLREVLDEYVDGDRADQPHEEAIRELALADSDFFGVIDVTGMAWIEIDFPEDIENARKEILPRIMETDRQ